MTHIAFTDHDTTKQSEIHKRLAASYGIRAIQAVEMSAYDYESRKKFIFSAMAINIQNPLKKSAGKL